MIKLIKYQLVFFLLSISAVSFAQEGTRNTNNTSTEKTGKILIVPFEPIMYMSEIDQKINQQTKWNFEGIRENFRRQLDNQLKLQLQSIAPVISFYSDSTKMAKDLAYIYKSTDLSYDLVDKPTQATAPTQKQNGIKNGQIAVEANNDKKFMNTKINNNELVPYLSKKYQTDYIVFINELDIKNDMASYDMTTNTFLREVIVHYSIIDKTGKTINAGISTTNFSSQENNPKKITAQSFNTIAKQIANTLLLVVNAKK